MAKKHSPTAEQEKFAGLHAIVGLEMGEAETQQRPIFRGTLSREHWNTILLALEKAAEA